MFGSGCPVCGNSDTFLGSKCSDGRKICMECTRKVGVIPEAWLYPSHEKYIKTVSSQSLAQRLQSVRTLYEKYHDIDRVFYDTAQNRLGGGPFTGGFTPEQIVIMDTMGKSYAIRQDASSGKTRAIVEDAQTVLPQQIVIGEETNGVTISIWIRLNDNRQVRMPLVNQQSVKQSFRGESIYRGIDMFNLSEQQFYLYRDLFIFLIEEGENIKAGRQVLPDVF